MRNRHGLLMMPCSVGRLQLLALGTGLSLIHLCTRLSVIGGLDYWNGLLEWTTGMDFDLFSSFFLPQELTI